MTTEEQEHIDRLVKQAELRQEKLDWVYTKCPLKFIYPWIIWNEFSNSGIRHTRQSWGNA